MAARKKVPDDLMETILGETPGTTGGEPGGPKPRGADRGGRGSGSRQAIGEGPVRWEEHPERVGISFNLSKQVSMELDKIRTSFEPEGAMRPSRSEIAELALRLAIEDVRERGGDSELLERLGERQAAWEAATVEEGGRTTQRSVDEAGFIVETIYDGSGEIVDEDVVGTVADLPVEVEYVDDEGRLVSLAKDELGNTFEQVMDNSLNILRTRLLPNAD